MVDAAGTGLGPRAHECISLLDHIYCVLRRRPPPLLADHCVLDSPDGLLLLQRDADTAVRLLHPFTGDLHELPPLTSLTPQLDRRTDHRPLLDADEHKVQSFRRISAAVSVAPTAGTVTVLLALEHICRFAHASTGDRRWTLTSWSENRVAMRNQAFCA
ncbi:uncharacterized protein [Setaria viridis]|uniref:uncharacterized protein n=1 Tax=Setaria viridis TaxID=4556 RepID=UPI003B3A7263